MTSVKQIESKLFELAPQALQMDWDNVGLLLGNPQTPVAKILVALDITEEVAQEALEIGAQLIVAHHPVINCRWLPVQTVRDDTPQGRLLLKLLRGNISAICMHTNLDAAPCGVNDALAAALRILDPGPLGTDGIGRFGDLAQEIPLEEFLRQVLEALHGNGLRYAAAGKKVRRVAVGGGACSDYIDRAITLGCDTFVTSDIGYHSFLDAKSKGINLIDAGHFPTEDVVCAPLIAYLQSAFPELSVQKSTAHREVIQYEI